MKDDIKLTPEEIEKRKALYQQAIDRWGKALQLVMVLEESSELQKEVCKIIRGDWSQKRMDSLAEEIADVSLCIEQLVYMTFTGDMVEKYKTKKLARLKRLLSIPNEAALKSSKEGGK